MHLPISQRSRFQAQSQQSQTSHQHQVCSHSQPQAPLALVPLLHLCLRTQGFLARRKLLNHPLPLAPGFLALPKLQSQPARQAPGYSVRLRLQSRRLLAHQRLVYSAI